MPPNARVIIFDDTQDLIYIMSEILLSEGHDVIGSAKSIESLENNLDQWASETSSRVPNVALIDNQAPWHDGESPDYKGVGDIAERKIKASIENIITIATTGTDPEEAGYGDFRYAWGADDGNIGEFITQISAKEK